MRRQSGGLISLLLLHGLNRREERSGSGPAGVPAFSFLQSATDRGSGF